MLNRLRPWRTAEEPSSVPSEPAAPPTGTRLYCVGDIHGTREPLTAIHDRIRADAEAAEAERKVLVYLGDYVDRGSHSREVVEELIAEPLEGFDEIVHLAGNHEAALLSFLEEPNSGTQWLSFGGLATLESYGVAPPPEWPPMPQELAVVSAALQAAMPAHHLAFFQNLKASHLEGDLFLVHAGIRPRIALDRQKLEDLFWIREPFLTSDDWHGKLIVHGHSITKDPEVRPNRVGIDTGAYRTGKLTCVVFQDGERQFLYS